MQEANAADQTPFSPVIGVDIGGTQLRTAVLLGGQLRSRVSMITGANPTPERILPRILRAIEQAIDEAHIPRNTLAGIGVAMPGPLNYRTGIIYSPPNLPGWEQVPLRDIFLQHYTLPVYIENDAHTAALGEYMFGTGRGCKNLVYLTISTGIGGGVIIDGKILEGANGTAAELGHMSIDWHGQPCSCGNMGCLEYLASGTAIARMANEAIADGQGAELLAFASTMLAHPTTVPDQAALPAVQEPEALEQDDMGEAEEPLRVNARTVARAAEAGIPLARSIITQAGEALGVGLVNIIHIFNPEMIILGGGVMLMGDMLMEPAQRIVQERTMQAPRDAARIVIAQLGANAGLVGAGALVYHYSNS